MADYSWAVFFSPLCFLEWLEKGETLQVQREREREGKIRFPMCIQMFFHAPGTGCRREKVWLQDPGFNTPISLFFFFSHTLFLQTDRTSRAAITFQQRSRRGKKDGEDPGIILMRGALEAPVCFPSL